MFVKYIPKYLKEFFIGKYVLLSLVVVSLNFMSSYLFAEGISKERVIFHTNYGDIAVAFYPIIAPKTTAQILNLVRLGVYDGAAIFRIEKGYVAQVENFDTHQPELTSEQREAVKKLPAEFSKIPHRRGLLSMARYDDINSGESSFSFMLGDAPHLDGQYTVFGEVVAGMNILDALEAVPVDGENKPKVDVVIDKAEIISNGDLSQAHLSGPKTPNVPEAPYQLFFEIFASLAFTVTVIIPIIKGFKGKPSA